MQTTTSPQPFVPVQPAKRKTRRGRRRIYVTTKRVDNVRRVLDLADQIDLDEGRDCYRNFRRTMQDLADCYGATLAQATGVFAATSPSNTYGGNLRSAATLLAGHQASIPLDHLTVATFRHCAARAWRILEGEDFLDFTRGPKTRAFYQNILDPLDPDPVCIDGHMVSVFHGSRLTMKDAIPLRDRYGYKRIAATIRHVAADNGLVPCELQAVLWFTWKRTQRIAYNPQWRLIGEAGNFWRAYVAPQDIIPYKFGPRKITLGKIISPDEERTAQDAFIFDRGRGHRARA